MLRSIIYLLLISLLLNPHSLLSKEENHKKTVAVLLFEGDWLSVVIRNSVTSAFYAELATLNKYILVDRENIVEIEDEYKFESLGFVDENNEYYIEMGKASGAQNIITGKIELIGNLYQVTVKLIDTTKIVDNKIVTKEYYGKVEGLIKVARILAYNICDEEVPKSLYEQKFLNDKILSIPNMRIERPNKRSQKWWFWTILGTITLSSLYFISLASQDNGDSINVKGDVRDSDVTINKGGGHE